MRMFVLAALLALTACQAIHRTPDDKVELLKVGMTTNEVEELLGRPWHAIVRPFQTGNRETLEYLLTRGTRTVKAPLNSNNPNGELVTKSRSYHRVLVLEFVDGVLVAGKGQENTGPSEKKE